jgi:uncharacterized protein YbjT (DUF2867 family)
MKKILVIGATGLVGNAVANQLSNDGYHVIIMSRSREKAKSIFSDDFEIIEADVLNPESLKYSFQGVDGVYTSLPEKDVPAAMRNILKYARESNVKHIIHTSGCTVKKENAWHPMIRGHYEGERAIEASGIPFTFFKLTMIMEMIPRFSNNGKPFILGKKMHGWSWIHTSDIARMASAAFANEDAKNKKLTIWGKETSTIIQAVDRYNRELGLYKKPAKPRPYWMANLIALMAGEKMKYAISIFKYFDDHPQEGDPSEAYELLGEPQMRLERFFKLEKSERV